MMVMMMISRLSIRYFVDDNGDDDDADADGVVVCIMMLWYYIDVNG